MITEEKLVHLMCEIHNAGIDLMNNNSVDPDELMEVAHELAVMADEVKELASVRYEKKLEELASNYWFNIMEDHSEKSEYDKFLEGFKAGFNCKIQ